MYAEHKGLALDRARVTLSHQKVHVDDGRESDGKERKLDEITVRIHLDGDLDQATRQRLYEIADRCPVHRTLTSEIRIKSALEEG